MTSGVNILQIKSPKLHILGKVKGEHKDKSYIRTYRSGNQCSLLSLFDRTQSGNSEKSTEEDKGSQYVSKPD